MREVICPYCSNNAALVDSAVIYGKSYRMVWHCKPCDAYVGTHRSSPDHAPLGRLANAELREWKKKAHSAFDPLWIGKNGVYSRKEAYTWLRDAMDISADEAHIGKFDVEECKKLTSLLEGKFSFLKNKKES